jgi:hypothetical protein
MTAYRRLAVEIHDIDATDAKQAGEIFAARLNATRKALSPLGYDRARVLTINTDTDDDGLDDLLTGVMAADEIDPGDHRNPYPGYVPAADTDLRERLLAWRQAAIQDALRAAIPASILDDLKFIREDAADAIDDPAKRLAALHRILGAVDRVSDGLDLTAASHVEEREQCAPLDPDAWDEPLPAAVYAEHDGETD